MAAPDKTPLSNSSTGERGAQSIYPASPPAEPTEPVPARGRKSPSTQPKTAPSQDRASDSSARPPSLPPPLTPPPGSPRRTLSTLPTPPTTSAADDTQAAAILASLSKRRRHRPSLFRSHSSDSYDPDAEAVKIASEAEACQMSYRHIEIEVDGRVLHTEAELPPLPKVKVAHYAWEVMYENQRGITLFGKSWYSSNSLQPWDPTTFTLPLTVESDFILERPKATETPALQELDYGDDGRDDERPKTKTGQVKRKSIKTGYSLGTYQTPSPQWMWLTPWMANMRLDTDQQGWRYNLWFHTRQWVPHPGRLNWWGWVRRREWVRLRALLPPEVGPKEVDEEEVKEPGTLDEVLNSDHPVANIARNLASQALDREKLALWERWISEGSAAARHRIAELFEDQEKLVFIARAFLYPTARKAFYDSLVQRGIVEKKECMECAQDNTYVIE
ncbi:hypothetical protein CcaverHIS002_0701110 [Cutaneotrichosporon cavernicola]|uniref:Peroxin domain-containing protein n=1 Tax=Cutaneotrichosporon cavernicola TaxID=279322 RepID=A0AA48L9S8_9TREE|nr:uncharacterized protein CcaverHIS019_0701120 [Cutaneotrichosporon cavernicola]BEI86765.1 hypothetical protein CcaverHIS002_0701110 [Cutaneotrichosporon cavernicola]BEI94540.1 hypothetical protein CcaverHIS019_0701120 [Cutaneotrichosporon cavernicola]BEJ02316.1 hypothetical protein CcaverHIS631_0701110 [Cutaneotrichosporon cavernicola]BEJ10075.1 hypothetical protein CcaverHIS641_0701100 [Cutaneotrichosporon cavernicola]